MEEPDQPKARLKCVQCGYEAEVTPRKELTVGKMIPGLCPDCKGNMIVVRDKDSTHFPMPVDRILATVRTHFPVQEIHEGFNHLRLEVGEPYGKDAFSETMKALEAMGFLPIVRRFGQRDVMTIFPRVEEAPARVRTNLILLGLTVISTFVAGLTLTGFFFGSAYFEVAKWDAIMYSLGIMAILGLHEMGHKLASMRFKVEASYPYFIPVPPPMILGTMGAVIKMKGSLPNRSSMLKIGAAGPICGFLVAIPVTMIGLSLSTPQVAFDSGGTSIVIGASVLFRVLRNLVVPDAIGLHLHPLAVAGWAGMLVTMLNLFPAGMLDGGHVSRSVFGMKIHHLLGYATGATLLGLYGVQLLTGTAFAGWLLWGILVLFFTRVGHPGSLDESTRLNRTSIAIGLSVLVIFFLTATALPIRLVDEPKVYVSSLTAQPVDISGIDRTYEVRARLANMAALNSVHDIEARILLPEGASLLPESEPVQTVALLKDSIDVTWKVMVRGRVRDLEIYCFLESLDGGSDQARLVLG
jgi:membrane-associated protease RseP (regulator of RpoE activity)